MSKLFIIPTPIGNLSDISHRAIQTLFLVDILLCEDTRTTQKLLQHYKKADQKLPKLVAYHEHNEESLIPQVLLWLSQSKNIGIVSDAGTPLISDPGFQLVKKCQQKNIQVVPIPGANAAITALSASGLPTNNFLYLGFLPKKNSNMQKTLTKLQQMPIKTTIIFYQSPQRMPATIQALKSIWGEDLELTIARELTKIYEDISTKTLKDWGLQTEFRGEMVGLFKLAR